MADIIRNALETIAGLADIYLQSCACRDDSWLALTSTLDREGAPNPAARDKIVMTVYNFTSETTLGANLPVRQIASGESFAAVSPPLHLNVHLMFTANFTDRDYGTGLAMLSRLISYFQQMPENALAPEIDRMTLELENLEPADVQRVTAMLGTHYLPSVFYKLRMLTFASPAIQARVFPVIERPSPAS